MSITLIGPTQQEIDGMNSTTPICFHVKGVPALLCSLCALAQVHKKQN